MLLWNHSYSDVEQTSVIKEPDELSPVERKLARQDYFFRMLRDPATNSIPPNIRSRELEYSRTLPDRGQIRLRSGGSSTSFTWHSLGPNDVGGRTRALGIDRRNSDIVIAGGVSGGIWKSTDGFNLGTKNRSQSKSQRNISGSGSNTTRPLVLYIG